MKKKIFIENLSAGMMVDDIFLLYQSILRTTKRGGFYLDVVLSDCTGKINARFWDATKELAEKLPQDSFVRVRAIIELYENKPQAIIHFAEVVPDESIDPADFLPACEFDLEKLFSELMKNLDTVKDKSLKALAEHIFNNKEVVEKFKKAPAGTSLHHAYIGGLLEHSLSVTKLAVQISENYQHINRDLLVVGAALHDIGKIDELTFVKSFKYSDRGLLLGHLVIGTEMITKAAEKIEDFSPLLLSSIQHLILSHHGEYEYGSPKLPMTAEAIALHYIDNLDAKLQAVKEAVPTDGNWTNYHRMLDRRLFIPDFEKESE
ncbi:MAG: HD domain-containing protein [Planctomycetota bacterium]